MIYLKDQNIIFLKPRKVASTSFELALSKYCGKNDILTPLDQKDEKERKDNGFVTAQNYNYSISEIFHLAKREKLRFLMKKQYPRKFFNHITADLTKKRIGEQTWNRATKVSIVRNPFDQILSYFYYARDVEKRKVGNFEAFCRNYPGALGSNNRHYFINDQMVIDHLIRFENFDEDIQCLEHTIPSLSGLLETFKCFNSKNNVRPKSSSAKEYFKNIPDVVQAVNFFSSYEIKKFGYKL